MASHKYGGKVISGELPDALLDGDVYNYDMERGYTRHAINEIGDQSIIIKLSIPFIINHICMLLWDRDLR